LVQANSSKPAGSYIWRKLGSKGFVSWLCLCHATKRANKFWATNIEKQQTPTKVFSFLQNYKKGKKLRPVNCVFVHLRKILFFNGSFMVYTSVVGQQNQLRSRKITVHFFKK